MGYSESAVGTDVDPVLGVRGRCDRCLRRDRDRLRTVAKQAIEGPREKTSFVGSAIRTSSSRRAKGLNRPFYQLLIVLNMIEHKQKC
jgi:hypothetical protein